MTVTTDHPGRNQSTTDDTALAVQAGHAPFVRQAWYVIAASADVGRELSSLTVMDQPLVFYRDEEGAPIVLDDRCAHRRYSLAKGRLKGDAVQCGYHGFTFDRTGACVFAPGVKGDLNFGVRRFPAVDCGVWLWVWMGDGEGDPADIPYPEVAAQIEEGFDGYTYNPCNYVLLHENLLDLTHLTYLHLVADDEYASVPPTLLKSPDEGSVGQKKIVPSTNFMVPAMFCGVDPMQLVRQEEELWSVGPSLNYGSQVYYLPDGAQATPHRLVVVHAITPESATTTHQFWTMRTSAPMAVAKEDLVNAVRVVFQQDVEVLSVQSSYIKSDDRAGVVENSIPSDVAGLRVRRMLQRLAERERG